MFVSPHTAQPSIVIRTASSADRPALSRLAALDSAAELDGSALVDLLELRAHPRRRAA